MAKKSITPDYTKKAIQRYNDKFDRIAVNLPKGTKDKIKELTGLSCNKYISSLVLEDLKRMEEKNNIDIDLLELESDIEISKSKI